MHGVRVSEFWVHKNRGKLYPDTVVTYNEHNLSYLLMTWKPAVTLSDLPQQELTVKVASKKGKRHNCLTVDYMLIYLFIY